MIIQNNPLGLYLESTGAIFVPFKRLSGVQCTIPVLFLFRALKDNLDEKSIFHFPGAFRAMEAKHASRCFNVAFED